MSSLHPSDHLHGLGRREGAGLRPGPNVLAKVPRSEGILAFQVLCASRKLTPRLPLLHFSRLFFYVFVAEPDFPHLMLMPRRGGGVFLSRLLSVACAASICLLIDDAIKSVYVLPAIR